jgi:hypothetical protein
VEIRVAGLWVSGVALAPESTRLFAMSSADDTAILLVSEISVSKYYCNQPAMQGCDSHPSAS